MSATRLVILWLALFGCGGDPAPDDPADSDTPTVSGGGVFSTESSDGVESVSFELSTPTLDACDGCDFHAAVSGDGGRIGEHIAWDEADQRLLVHDGTGWMPFRTEAAANLSGSTWTSSFREGGLDVSIEVRGEDFNYCDEESGRSLSSPPATSAVDAGFIDCDLPGVSRYTVPMRAGETIDLHVTAPPGNDPYVMLGDGECLMAFFDDGLPCHDEDRSRFCSAATFTAPADMDLDIIVDWFDCGPDGFEFELAIGGDIVALPEADLWRYADPYYGSVVTSIETVQLTWTSQP